MEDLIRTGLDNVPGGAPPPGLGPSVRARSQRRRRGQVLAASLATGGVVAGGVTLGLVAFDNDEATRPSVLAASATPATSSCSAGPFTLSLNGQPVTATKGFREVGGVTVPGPAHPPPAEDLAPGSPSADAWTLSPSQGNVLRVSVPDGVGTTIRLVEFTLVANADSPRPAGLAEPTTADSDESHASAQAPLNLILRDSRATASPGYYGLDVMVSLLSCPTGAVHIVQPVQITS